MKDILDNLKREIPGLRRYARFLASDIDRADDLVQECLERAITKIDSFQPETNLRAWLFTILRNAFINNLRREARSPIGNSLASDNVALYTHGDQEAHLQLLEVQRAFDTLPEEHREILLLVAVEGMQYEEAAAVLEIAVGTVRSRLSRARHSLRDKLGGLEPQSAEGES